MSVSITLRILVAAVLAAAAIGKLRSAAAYREFVQSLFSVGIPRRLVSPLAALLIGTEVVAALLLPWPSTAIAGSLVATVLLVVLAVGVGRAVRRGIAAHCRCFGTAGGELRWFHVGRNAGLALVAAVGGGLTALSAGAAPPRSDVVPAAALGLTAAVLVVFADGIGSVSRHTQPQKGNS